MGDEYHNGFEGGDETVNDAAVKEEAQAEEEFISAPEDTIENPLVPEEKSEGDSEEENRLEGAIGTGDLEVDYPEEKEVVSNEENAAKVEEKPAEEAAPASEAETVVSPAPEPTVEEAAAAAQAEPKKKKSKKGLVITLIIIALLLIGGGVGAFFWIMAYEAPENQLKDAMNKLWTAENIQATISANAENNGTNANVTFDSIIAGSSISGNGAIKTNYQGVDVNIKFSAAYAGNDEIYLKLDSLKETMEALNLNSLIGSFVGESYAEILSTMLNTIVEKVEGNWYKIPVSATSSLNNNQLSCLAKNAKASDSIKSEVAKQYENHAFLKINKDAKVVDKDGLKYYEIEVDKDASKAFIKALKESDSTKEIASCLETEEEKVEENPTLYQSLDPAKLDTKCGESKSTDCVILPEEEPEQTSVKTTKIKFGIKPWTHELGAIDIKVSEGEEKTTATSIKLSYDKKDVTMPSDAADISTLSTTVEEAYRIAITKMIKKECEAYSSYGDNMVKLCEETALKQVNNYKIEDLLKNFSL